MGMNNQFPGSFHTIIAAFIGGRLGNESMVTPVFYSTKTVITGDGPLELRTPRDRDGTFEPQLVKKNQTRITGMDNQILSLYAKGMTTREIAAAFKELYDADVSLNRPGNPGD